MIDTKNLSLSFAEEKILELFSSAIKYSMPQATKIILFGSRARGLSNEESDLDVAVVVKSSVNKSLWDIIWSIKWELLSELFLEEFPLSLTLLSEEEFNSDTALIREIKKDGVLLWERS
ncbi:nucleotidyltransferase domain-containing protein [Thermodesulfovibrio sp. TK110]